MSKSLWALALFCSALMIAGCASRSVAEEPALDSSAAKAASHHSAGMTTVRADAAVTKEIRAFYKELEVLNDRGDAAAILDWYYWPDVVHGGQGSRIYRSKEEFRPFLQAMIKDEGTECHANLDSAPILASGKIAVVYYEFACRPSEDRAKKGLPGYRNRVVDVLEKRGTQWKLIRQNWSDGSFDVPE